MAQVIFNPLVGVELPSTQEIREDLGAKIQQAFQTSPTEPLLNIEPSSPMGQVLDLIVSEIEAKNSEIVFLANMANPDTATGKYLDALAALYGLERKISEPTVVNCILSGLRGTFIPYGAIAQDALGNQYRHSNAGGALIDDTGSVVSAFTAINHGPIEVAAGSVNRIVTTIAGWDSITNPTAGVIGRDEETDAELRNRMIESYAVNATGYVEAIEANLAALEGVLDVRVLENPTNSEITQYGVSIEPHSILIAIVGGEDSEIARTIYQRKDAGCGTTGNYEVQFVDEQYYNATYNYKIVRPENRALKISVSFFGTNMNETEKKNVIQSIIQDVLGQGANDRVSLASTIYASRFYPAIQSQTTAPIAQIQVGLETGAIGSSVQIPANIEPTISESDVAIIFTGN
ncbi:baseplate J/gp47 family protein [uncultured Parasutterella sp.]|uniref:baseplate J/gp47 family protein n=1 Tax=uncultured Parasutterella sp. TaxID=1263098 RepID=UPI0025B63F69|nr:baseplate J/gp47 family protein [uncultured Parasutterella sp.]